MRIRFKRDKKQSPNESVERARINRYVPLYDVANSERMREDFCSFAEVAYRGNAVVFSLCNRRAQIFSEATLRYRSKKDKAFYMDESLSIFNEPWPNAQLGDLLTRMIQDVDLSGNSYVVNRGDRLERLRPDHVSIISELQAYPDGGQVREIVGYAFTPYDDPDRSDEYFTVDQLGHWAPTPDPLGNFRGMSWLTPVVREVNIDIALQDFTTAYLENAATPNLILKYADTIDPTAKESLAEMLEARYAGSGNAFKTLVVDSGGQPEVVGSDMRGAAFEVLQAAGENRLAAAAGMPPLVAGLRQGSQTSLPGDYPDQVRAFIDLTMRPLWRSAVAALQKLVDVPAEAELWFDTTDVAAMQQGEKAMAETAQTQATTLASLIMNGFEPDSAIRAVTSGDMSLLVHTGLTSVQMHSPGDAATQTTPANPQPPSPSPSPNGNGAQPMPMNANGGQNG